MRIILARPARPAPLNRGFGNLAEMVGGGGVGRRGLFLCGEAHPAIMERAIGCRDGDVLLEFLGLFDRLARSFDVTFALVARLFVRIASDARGREVNLILVV